MVIFHGQCIFFPKFFFSFLFLISQDNQCMEVDTFMYIKCLFREHIFCFCVFFFLFFLLSILMLGCVNFVENCRPEYVLHQHYPYAMIQ